MKLISFRTVLANPYNQNDYDMKYVMVIGLHFSAVERAVLCAGLAGSILRMQSTTLTLLSKGLQAQ